MPHVQIEKRQRGVFGYLIAIIFWGWNALCLIWLVTGVMAVSSKPALEDSLQQGAYTAGAAIGIGAIIIIWALGAVISGILMFFTRGPKKIIILEQ